MIANRRNNRGIERGIELDVLPDGRIDQLGEVGLDDASLILRLDSLHLLPRSLRFDGEHVVGRHEAGLVAAADVCQLCIHAADGLGEHARRFARGHERPVGPRDFELQIGARGIEVLARGGRFGFGRSLQRLEAAAGIDRPLELDTGQVVVGYVGIQDL